MDKISFFELFSFLIPGILVNALVFTTFQNLEYSGFLPYSNSIGENFVAFGLAIISGLFIHRSAFYFAEKRVVSFIDWFSPNINEIVSKNDGIKLILPKMEEQYKAQVHNIESPEPQFLFTLAYYNLEVAGKIEPSKYYQSFFFLSRNTSLICLLGIILQLVEIVCKCITEVHVDSVLYLFKLVLLIVGIFICSWLSKWYRRKMIERVFWSYHVMLNDLSKPK